MWFDDSDGDDDNSDNDDENDTGRKSLKKNSGACFSCDTCL